MKAQALTYGIAITGHEAAVVSKALYFYARMLMKRIDSFETYEQHQADITTASLLEQEFGELAGPQRMKEDDK